MIQAHSTPPRRFKRRIIIIKRVLQTKYVFLVFMSVFIASILMCWDVFNTFRDIETQIGSEVYPLLQNVQRLMVIKLLLFLIVVVWFAVFASHRFAGPVLRLRRSMRQLAQGEHVEPIKFRKGDFWPEFADEFNAVLARVQGQARPDASDVRPASIAKEQPLAAATTAR